MKRNTVGKAAVGVPDNVLFEAALPEPDELAEELIENLEAGVNSFRELLAGLEKGI